MGKIEVLKILVRGAAELGLSLDEKAVARFSIYMSLLQLWGSKMNLSSRLDDLDIIIYHFLDSLSGARWFLESQSASVIDLGAGAGFPSIPLKIVFEDLRVSLLESSRKKVSFCKEVIRAAQLTGVEALWGRGEEIGKDPEHQRGYDWSVCRALGRADAVLKISQPFLRPRGKVLLYKGHLSKAETTDLNKYCDRVGAVWELHPVSVPYLKETRTHIIIKNQ